MVTNHSRLLVILLILISADLSAQIDSVKVQTDTVFIHEDPVIINGTYFMPPDTSYSKKSWWFAGIHADAGINTNRRKISSPHRFPETSSFGIILGKELNKVSFETGLSIFSSNGGIVFNGKFRKDIPVTKTVNDTIDIYTETINGVKKNHYITEEKQINTFRKEIYDSSWTVSESVDYLVIPVAINYKLIQGKWGVLTGMGVNSHFLTGNNKEKEKVLGTELSHFFMAAKADVSVSRELFPNLNIHAGIQYIFNITPVTDKSLNTSLRLMTSGIRINYFF